MLSNPSTILIDLCIDQCGRCSCKGSMNADLQRNGMGQSTDLQPDHLLLHIFQHSHLNGVYTCINMTR